MYKFTSYLLLSMAVVTSPVIAQTKIKDLNSPLPGGNLRSPQETQQSYMRGQFPKLTNPEQVVGGHIQEIWAAAPSDAGDVSVDWKPGLTIKMSLRTGMVSTIVLPPYEKNISDIALGDVKNFQHRRVNKHPNKLWVWATHAGYDTNLTLVGGTGAVYPFYMQSETAKSWNFPSLTVRLSANAAPNMEAQGEYSSDIQIHSSITNASMLESVETLGENFPDLPDEWISKGCTYDPTMVRHNRKMTGDGDIAPVWVFTDKCFTYLDFGSDKDGKKAGAIYAVKDEVNNLVNISKSKDGRFVIVHSKEPLSIINGKKVVCIRDSETEES